MTKSGINYGRWALKVITWDALLPSCIAFTPLCIRFFFPNRRGALELTAVILPIIAFLLRFRAGKRYIDSNLCSVFTQKVQLYVFCLGILPLVLFDCFVILSELMPRGIGEMRKDWVVWVILLSAYLISMIIAMYPGRTESLAEEAEDLLCYHDVLINEI
jgi:hypothetical protein